ncbi:villin-4-like isoform X1 [Magnolia sinica]|uniref:villin-4-like isoform X1 n=2 Tax=Magnolia sinica TaxID=86752 RepID=UPI00265AC157|nr:villin-4-like isoform X1 [Magnolia sinica]
MHISVIMVVGAQWRSLLPGIIMYNSNIQEERTAAISLASKMVESLKFQPVQARIFEGKEPIQFFSIFQSFMLFKGGVSSGYKNYMKVILKVLVELFISIMDACIFLIFPALMFFIIYITFFLWIIQSVV